TPALAEALVPLNELRERAQREYRAALRKFKFDSVASDATKDKIEKDIRAALKKGSDVSALRDQYEGNFTGPRGEKRYVTSDATIEKLGEILNENPRGVMIFRDELSGFLRSMERPGHESDRAFFLESWDGTHTKFDFDRIGRGTIHIEALCISILGGI